MVASSLTGYVCERAMGHFDTLRAKEFKVWYDAVVLLALW